MASLSALLLLATLVPSWGVLSTGAQTTVERFTLDTKWRLQERSPDGTMIVVIDTGPTTVCTFAIPTGQEIACADLEDRQISMRAEDVAWAPDSRSFVFAEQGLTYLVDGDLWRFEARTGDLTNLTDDGVSGPLPLFSRGDTSEPFYVDVAPAWSPDGATIAFSRSTFTLGSDMTPSELWTLDVASGKQTVLARFDREVAGVLYYGMAWSSDGSAILVSVSHPDYTDERNGVWAVSAASGEATQLTGASAELDGHAPSILSISPAGNDLILEYPYHIHSADLTDDRSGFALLEIDTGDVTPIEVLAAHADAHAVPVGPTFAANGEYIVFAVRNLTAGEGSLIARHIESGAESTVATLPNGALPFTANPGEAIGIGADGTAFTRTELFEGYLVQLPDDLLPPSTSA